MRILALLACLAALAPAPACADSTATMISGRMPSLSQGRPPADRFAPAPVPNPDLQPPRANIDPYAVAVSPTLTRTETAKTTGDGFAPGSTFSGSLERRDRGPGGIGSTLAPSLRVKVPVQVEFR
jgi:hypothetical protein